VGTNFSRGSGTAKKLTTEFGLKPNKDTLAAVTDALFKHDRVNEDFLNSTLPCYRKMVVENTLCKQFIHGFISYESPQVFQQKVRSNKHVDTVIVKGSRSEDFLSVLSNLLLSVSEE